MKIKSEDLTALETAIRPVLDRFPQAKQSYLAKGLTLERFRWDVLHASGFNLHPLYSYLNDSHISTALKAIIK